MLLRIREYVFDSNELLEVRLREDLKEVFVTTTDDFYRIRYRKEEDITDVRVWEKLHDLKLRDINEAVYTLKLVCDFYINTKEQCKECPLKKHMSCIFTDIPMNWKQQSGF